MTFEEWCANNQDAVTRSAQEAWRRACKPDIHPLTEEEIRQCWAKCGKQAPMAFAEELQRKLGIIKDVP